VTGELVGSQGAPLDEGGRAAGGSDAAALSEAERLVIRERSSPEGIVTILYTDIVESTRLRQRLGDDASQELFRLHDAILREQIAKHRGHEVKTQGDGFMVAFSDVVDAIAGAVDIQRAIAEHNREHPGRGLQVRVGLNCGRTIKQDEDFFGTAVVIAARLVALANGGQILVSDVVRQLSGPRADIRFLRHGRRRLKGLAGAYDVWLVPWQDIQIRGMARVWAKPAYRIGAVAALVTAITAGVAGLLALSLAGGGGGSRAVPDLPEKTTRFALTGVLHNVSGDCVSEDMVYRGNGEGDLTGDFIGHATATIEGTLYADTACSTGIQTHQYTATDAEGNTISASIEGPVSVSRAQIEDARPATTADRYTISGGTGIYEGAIGKGTCTSVWLMKPQPDTSIAFSREVNCRFKLAMAGTPWPDPVILELGAAPTEATVFGGPSDVPNTVAMAFLYENTRDSAQKGLTVRLPVPEGAQILATSRGEKQPVPEGERIWRLPDLAPGEIQRFEFTILLRAAENPDVSLVAEMNGESFERPASTEPLLIHVVH
jgi:class 3 adenylate cyclase